MLSGETSLVALWWNTGLSPLGTPRANATEKAFAANLIAQLRKSYHVDVVGLGEVCTEDLSAIAAAINDPHMSMHDATKTGGRGKFDTGVFFDREKLVLDSTETLTGSYGKTTLKIGEGLRFICSLSSDYLHIVVSHWPSRR